MFTTDNATDVLQEGTDYVTEVVTELASSDDDRRRGVHGVLWPVMLVTLVLSTNGLSLAAFAVEKRLRGYNNYFIINLTISDFVFGFLLIIISIHTYLGRYPLPSNNWCKVFYGVLSSVQFVSNLVIVVICVDRHRATYDPIGHFTSRSKRRALYANVCVWVVSTVFWFSFSTIPDFILQFNNTSGCIIWHFVYPIGNIVPILIRFIIPFFIMLILYVKIYIKIRETMGGRHINKDFDSDIRQSERSESDIGEGQNNYPSTAEHGGQKSPKRESASEVRSATKTLLFIVISFFITWLPSSLVSMTYAIKPSLIYPRFPDWFHLLPGWLVYVNPLLNPISYVISQPLFRKTVLGLICHPMRYCRG